MPAHWLQYWKPFQIKPATSELWLLNHSAGNQLHKASLGDTVWIVSVESPGRLIALGPIYVNHIVNQKEAEALVGSGIWRAKWHIINDTPNRAKYVDVTSLASSLRFESDKSPNLVLKKGRVSGTQFQQMRRLTPESAKSILHAWTNTKSQVEIESESHTIELDKLSSLDQKQLISVRREQKILRKILFGTSAVSHCGICGKEFPISLLVVAHIKPRAKCSDIERRDSAHNLMPLYLLGCDSLFEQGIISVDEGHITMGPNDPITDEVKERVGRLKGLPCKYWSQESKKYFEWRTKHPIRR